MKFFSTFLIAAAVCFSGLFLVSADDPIDTTVCDIQTYNGIQQGDRVRVSGICTAETGRYGSNDTVISDIPRGEEAYCCGLWIYVTDADLVALRGECVEVVGIVQEYYDKTELYVGSEETIRPIVTTCSDPLPDPIYVKTSEGEDEKWESCIVEAHCLTLTSDPDEFGTFTFADDKEPYGEMHGLFALAWEPPVEGDFYCMMRGVLDYHWSFFKIRPRDQSGDLDETQQSSCELCEGGPGPTPTPVPCDPATADLSLNKEQPNCFIENDLFSLTVSIENDCPAARNVDAYCVLDVYGEYFFWGSWGQDLDFMPITLPANGTHNRTILEFIWPPGAGTADNLNFWFVCTDPGTFDLASSVDFLTFCFQ